MDINEKGIQKNSCAWKRQECNNLDVICSETFRALEENNHLLDVLQARTILLTR